MVESWPPSSVRLNPESRILFLTKDLELIKKQLYDGLDLQMKDLSVEDLLDEYGADRLFYPIPEDKEVLKKYHTRHTHGDREVLTCEEIQ